MNKREELKESILHYLGEVYEDSNLGEIADRILALVKGPVTTFRYSPLEQIQEDTPEEEEQGLHIDPADLELVERVAIYLHNWCACHVEMDICRKSAVKIISVIGGTQ